MTYSKLLIGALVPGLASAAVTVRKTGKAPTGYEVDFTYFNSTAANVTIGGGFNVFTDQFHTSLDGSASYNPTTEYQAGDFWAIKTPAAPTSPYNMTCDGKGNWELTIALPSSTYTYAFIVDCANLTTCGLLTNQLVIDPDNPPVENVKGDAVSSQFQVPWDEQFQFTSDIDLNFDFQLPVQPSQRGTFKYVNYTSPGSIHPAPNIHYFGLYLPPGYSSSSPSKYPLFYLSHGGIGDASDWANMANVSNIMDNLICDKYIEPTVVVLVDFYNLNASYPWIQGNSSTGLVSPPPAFIRENYFQFLFPFVEANYHVSTDPSRRAFAGLSLGGILTNEFFTNATDYFDYYGFLSGNTGSNGVITAAGYINASEVEKNPALAKKGIYTSLGAFDLAAQDVRNFQAALDALDIPFVSHLSPFGFHYWNTWADALWHFGQKALWQPLPFTTQTGRNVPNSPIM